MQILLAYYTKNRIKNLKMNKIINTKPKIAKSKKNPRELQKNKILIKLKF